MLQVKKLSKVYQTKKGTEVRALDNVSLDFPETGMVFLLGKSGSGKSTMLNVCGGLDSPTSGEIIVKGRSSKNFTQSDFDSYRNTFIGFVFQEYNILNEFSVEDNIALALELQGKSKDPKAIAALLEQVELSDYAKRKPNTLSGGQKQRIAIARALIKDPQIIMADEPTGALDSNTGKQVLDILKKLSQDKLVIVVSHDREFAEQYGDRIIELQDGRVLSDVSKYENAPTKLSENVSAMGDVLCIKNGAKLSDNDFANIQEFLKSAKHDVVIAANEKDVAAFKKVSRIQEEGVKEFFDDTKDVPVKTYTKEDSCFITSKLPLRHAFKIGISGMKRKPLRLLLTILLCTVAFTLFGLLTTLNFYNSEASFKKSLSVTDRNLIKLIREYPVEVQTYVNGVEDYNYTTRWQGAFGEEDLAHYQGTLSPDVFGAVSAGFSYNVRSVASGYWNTSISHVAYLPENNALREAINGEYPDAEDEIVISSYSADMMYHCGTYDSDGANITLAAPSDLIGKRISIFGAEYTITGILDTGTIDPEYDAILNGYSDKALLQDYESYLADSVHLTAFVSYDCLCKIYTETTYWQNGHSDNTYIEVATKENGEYSFSGMVNAAYHKVSELGTAKPYFKLTADTVTGDNEAILDFRILNMLVRVDKLYEQAQTEQDYEQISEFLEAMQGATYGEGQKHPTDGGEPETITYTEAERVAFAKQCVAFILEHNLLPTVSIKLGNTTDGTTYGDAYEFDVVGVVLNVDNMGMDAIYLADQKADVFWEEQKYLVQYYEEYHTEYTQADDATYTHLFVPFAYSEELTDAIWQLCDSDGIDEGMASEVCFDSLFLSTLLMVDSVVNGLSETFLIIGLIMAVFAVLLFSNFISASISQKTRDIGVLRAVGARATDVFRIFFSESFLIVLICAVLSVAATYITCNLIDTAMGEGIGVTILTFGWMSVAVLLLSAFLTAVVSTFLPVYHAARKKPIDSIRTV